MHVMLKLIDEAVSPDSIKGFGNVKEKNKGVVIVLQVISNELNGTEKLEGC